MPPIPLLVLLVFYTWLAIFQILSFKQAKGCHDNFDPQLPMYFFALYTSNIFGIVVAVTFQIIFYTKIHVNDVFLFFKNYFLFQHIKTIQNVQIILNFSKKKLNFLITRFAPVSNSFVIYLLRMY